MNAFPIIFQIRGRPVRVFLVETEALASTVSIHTSVGVLRGSVAGTVRQVGVVIGYSDVNIVPFRLLIGQV